MSYLLGQMDATRIIGESIHATGEKAVTQTNAYDAGLLLMMLGKSFITAADVMEAKIRSAACADGIAPDQPREGPRRD
ncbi:MAG: hypothetical protein ABW128_07100 [Rhizorhabdus sp.]